VVVGACPVFMSLVLLSPQKLLERLEQLVSTPFERITYTEAIDILLKPENVGCFGWVCVPGPFYLTPVCLGTS
jgi:hypothetical protein